MYHTIRLNALIFGNDSIWPTYDFNIFHCQDIDSEAMRILDLCYERAKEVCYNGRKEKD